MHQLLFFCITITEVSVASVTSHQLPSSGQNMWFPKKKTLLLLPLVTTGVNQNCSSFYCMQEPRHHRWPPDWSTPSTAQVSLHTLTAMQYVHLSTRWHCFNVMLLKQSSDYYDVHTQTHQTDTEWYAARLTGWNNSTLLFIFLHMRTRVWIWAQL